MRLRLLCRLQMEDGRRWLAVGSPAARICTSRLHAQGTQCDSNRSAAAACRSPEALPKHATPTSSLCVQSWEVVALHCDRDVSRPVQYTLSRCITPLPGP